MGNLTFNEEIHEYRLDGRRLPSVTTILKEMGFIDTTWFTEESRQRGIIVHRLCELDDLGSLNPESVDPRLKGYLRAWQKYRDAEDLCFTHIEHRMASSRMGYAGTCDRVGIDRKGRTVLIDIKTSPEDSGPYIEWQLGAYKCLLREEGLPHILRLLSIHLEEDGEFRVQEWGHAPQDWMAILRTYHIRERIKK